MNVDIRKQQHDSYKSNRRIEKLLKEIKAQGEAYDEKVRMSTLMSMALNLPLSQITLFCLGHGMPIRTSWWIGRPSLMSHLGLGIKVHRLLALTTKACS